MLKDKSALGQTGLEVSPLCLGCGSYGGSMKEPLAVEMMDYYYELGGRFLDTAVIYCDWFEGERSSSQNIIGRWMQARKNRKELVLSVKGCNGKIITPTNDLATAPRTDTRLHRADIIEDIEVSMKNLRTDYLDLMLLHQPFGDTYGAWRALEELYREGKLRAIGISNHYADRMVEFANFTSIKPMVNQMETHPLNQQKTLKEWADKYDIRLEAWAPFGEGRNGLFENEVLKAIGQKYGKSTAQVMLRWHIQRGVIVIPKSVHKERMIENLNVFDFRLDENDMSQISQLDTATSAFFSHQDPAAMVEWFVKMVEKRKSQHDSSKEKKNW